MKLLGNQPVVTTQLDFYNEDSLLLGYTMNFCRITNVSGNMMHFISGQGRRKQYSLFFLILRSEDEALSFLRNGGSNL